VRAIRLYRRIGFADRGECRREIRGQTVEFWKMELDREHFSQLQIKILSKGQEFFSQGRRVRRERQKKRSANSLGFVLNSVVSACSARDDFASGSGLSGLGECGTDRRKEIVMTGPKRRALIVIDAQNDYVHGNLPIEYPPIELSLDNIGRAMDGAKSASIPIVAVQNMNPATAPFMALGTRGADLHEVVASRGWDHFVSKNMPSAFKGTDLENWLRERAIDTITVAGFMTHNCDLSTVLQAFHIGINVEVLADATGSLPYANRAGKATAEEIHRVMLVVMQSRFAAVMSVDEWLHAIATGVEPERDTIFSSNQRARRQ
jgi:nicotinamidase-related amidase